MALPEDHKSAVLPSVGFDKTIEEEVIEPFIEHHAGRFFKAQEGIEDIDQVHRIEAKNVITDIDWHSHEEETRAEFKYVYEHVMRRAEKRDGQTRQMAYAITFDRLLTTKTCEETDIQFETMTLAGEPILYYLKLDLGDIIAEVRDYLQ